MPTFMCGNRDIACTQALSVAESQVKNNAAFCCIDLYPLYSAYHMW